MDIQWLISLLSFLLALVVLFWWGSQWYRCRVCCDMRVWMIILFVLQSAGLVYEAVGVGACPVIGTGRSIFFVAWSINLFYLILGRSYRLSILGIFTLPVLSLLLGSALLYGAEEVTVVDSLWTHFHRGVMMIGSSAVVISAVAGVVFLVQNTMLKRQVMSSLSRVLPPIHGLEECMKYLMLVSFIIFVLGCVCGILVDSSLSIIKAVAVSVLMLGYVGMLWRVFRVGVPGKFLAYWSIGVLFISAFIFQIS